MRGLDKKDHVLVIGGTGMLRGVVKYFIEQGNIVSVVGRNRKRLQVLEQESQGLPGLMNPVAIDYTNTNEFIRAISHAISQYGPIRTSVNWIHSIAPNAPTALMELQNTTSPGSTYIRLLGSAYGNPAKQSNDSERIATKYPNIHYCEAILGFIVEDQSSRWLTHHEICQGVIEALESQLERNIIGTITPWSLRP